MFRENLVIFFGWILDFKCKKCGIYFGLNTTFVESFFFGKVPRCSSWSYIPAMECKDILLCL